MEKPPGKGEKHAQANDACARLETELGAILTDIEAEKTPDELLRLSQSLQKLVDHRYNGR